jgi:predicted nucleic acid-binding protein
VIVADTNLSIYLVVNSPYSEQAQRERMTDPHWIAPTLWRNEIRNVLSTHIKAKLLTLRNALVRLNELELMFDQRLYEVPSPVVLELASGSGCSSYDCEFVALAQQNDCPLVTMDKKLVKAFPETARLLAN